MYFEIISNIKLILLYLNKKIDILVIVKKRINYFYMVNLKKVIICIKTEDKEK